MMRRLILASLAALTVAACGNQNTQFELNGEANEATVRQVQSGDLIGFAAENKTYAWLGIPFAAPPVGDLRWRAPRPAAAWEGRREALQFGPACIQHANRLSGMPGEDGGIVGNEDCLTLNIWAPQEKSGPNRGPLPVMMWIHGGGNTIGSARTYFANALAGERDVVVVTINYRLGLFGWFSQPALQATSESPEDASGNYGTLDTIAALEWIRDNIEQFGGDPSNVTIFGESAGGRNVYALLASPKAEGLFHRAIVQSGSLTSTPLELAQNYSDDEVPGMANSSSEVAVRLSLEEGEAEDRSSAKTFLAGMSDPQMAAWLRAKSAEEIMAVTSSGLSGMYTVPQVLRDGAVLPEGPMRDAFKSAQTHNAVPIMTGTNLDENKLFLAQDPAMVNRFLGVFVSAKNQEQYDATARFLTDHWKASAVDSAAETILAGGNSNLFAYRWDWDEGAKNLFVDYSTLLGAAHGMEIGFVFGDFDRTFLPGFYSGTNVAGRDTLSDAMMSYWTEFAYNGNPGRGREGDLPEWTTWGSTAGNFVILDSEEGGGIRMSTEGVSFDGIKSSMSSDGILTVDGRCTLYARMFFLFEGGKTLWDEDQYNEMGCSHIEPYDVIAGF